MIDIVEWTICTKCGHGETGKPGKELSRLCTNPSCNYMRIIRSQGKDKVWEDERNGRLGWSEKEGAQLIGVMERIFNEEVTKR